MSARDELAAVIEQAYDLNEGMATFELLAHATIAAGYRKPRTITTAEELDALPVGSAVLDADCDVSTKHAERWHGYEMAPLDSRKFSKCGPFTVLYEPGAK
jgi:hypothetical protein